MKTTKKKWNPGDILKIVLANNQLAFARVLKNPLMAFYDLKTDNVPPIDKIISSPIAFKVWVMKYAVTKGVWPVIGNALLTPDLETIPHFFKRDPISGALSIYLEDDTEKPATFEECLQLECAAGWDPNHIIDRLNDHFAGRPNKWVELMRPKRQ